MNVPFLDLKTQHRKLEADLVEVFRDCLKNASFVGGHQVSEFEKEFAQFCGVEHAIGVSSGTDALRFALIAAGIGPGDEVITVPNTFIATTEAISQTGASFAFVDIDENTYNMDPNKLEEYLKGRKEQGMRRKGVKKNSKIGTLNNNRLAPHSSRLTPRPKAVIPVHLYGQPADMDPILELADRYGLVVIEDACQAHGALYYSKKQNKWIKAGAMGLAAAFSFYPGKNLGACGEAGAVTTNDEKLAQKIRMIRDHGQSKKYYHAMEGYNGRLDAIQAGMLRLKLEHLPGWNEKRRRNALLYTQYITRHLNPGAVVVPFVPNWAKPVFHLYIARASRREELQKYLSEKGIGTGLHYPIPLHIQDAYMNSGLKKGDFPITEKLAPEILSLPMFPELTDEQIEYVVKVMKEFYV